MTTAASIKAGEAWVGIHGKMGNLPEVLEKARQQVGTFAGSVEQFGEKVGTKFGTTIMNGLVGFAAVGAIDNVLRSVSDKMKAAMDGGAAFGFEEIGAAIGESIVEGLRSIQIVGATLDLGIAIGEKLLGSPMAQEKAQQTAQASSAEIALWFQNLEKWKAAASTELVSGKSFSIDDVRKYVSGAQAELIRLGANRVGAERAAQETIDAYARLVSQVDAGASAESRIGALLETFDEMSGVLDKSAMAAHRLEMPLREISELMAKSGRSPEDINQTLDVLRSDFEYSRLTQEANQRTKEIESLIESIERESKLFGKSQVQVLEYELKRLGATQEQMDRGLETALDLEDKQREAARRAEATTTVERSFGTFSQGAFDPRSVASNSVIGESTRETARNTRRMVALLERNQLVYGA